MKSMRKDAAVCREKSNFNYNKLQAVACIMSSAMVSVALIYMAIRAIA